jgi:hypothetical protein
MFQWYVWPISNLHEGFPFGPAPADSPQARRLQCLVAEARAAGVPARVLFGVLLDWARVVERHVQDDASHDALSQAITITDAALYRLGQPIPGRFSLRSTRSMRPTAASLSTRRRSASRISSVVTVPSCSARR